MNQAATIKELQHEIALYEDLRAYRLLYDLLFNSLHRFSYAFVKSNEAAEEIVSDVFVKLWQIRSRLMEIENLKEYLYIITKNFSLNYISKNYKHPVTTLDAIDLETVIQIRNPEEICISAEMVNRIKQVIQTLSPRCRMIFQLVREEDLRYKEVASILNISVFTVRNQLAIAVRKIGEALPDYQRSSVIQTPKIQ
ncbi:MAG: RNA polymerase sigma-70 factor [Bacteroidota bacterium]|nr:RNA polymerase sigma-70 factor [Bacteroidota bacterium]